MQAALLSGIAKPMRTLAIETASEACSIALFDGAEMIAHEHQVLGRGHAERLIPMIAELPDKGKSQRILVSLGPGSFTGVRIGIAAARALGVAWGAQVLGFPSLSLIAAMARADAGMPDDALQVTVCMNAGHGEWFVQDFGASGLAEGEAVSLSPDQAASRGTYALVAGNRAEEIVEAQSDELFRAHGILGDAARANLIPGGCLTENLTPLYGREPDAKPQAAK